jgi:glyoxylase-like metal-dependent hydrolase (beta-lactamase superfamily II)
MTAPRELAPGLFWLGACHDHVYMDALVHGCNSVYLVCGADCSLLVEAGHPRDLDAIERGLDRLLAQGVPEPRYVFTTHAETPHASGAGRWLARFPHAELCGDVHDMHLVLPGMEDRLVPLAVGDALDLGGTEFVVVEAVIRDAASTLWGYDRARRALFAGDGFAHGHYHELEHCGKVAEEAAALDLPDMTAAYCELALPWSRLTDMEPYIRRLDELVLGELDAAIIASTHGLPICDPRATLPQIREGLRLGGRHVN